MTTALAPRRRRLRELLPLLGPAMVAGVAYLDPGNVATNVSAGARYGYLLVWVVVVANAMAWLIQYLSAKLGLSTGESLPQLLGRRIRSRAGRYAYWVQAELVAMATDIAEVLGGSDRPRTCCSVCRLSSAASSPARCRCFCCSCTIVGVRRRSSGS